MVRKNRNDEWLALLSDAIKTNAFIRPNHKFTYKGKNLGSFLYRAERTNNSALLEKIKEAGFDYKKARKNSLRNQIHNQWLELLSEAIKEGVKIQINHRFVYKGKRLGTFLVGAKENKRLVRKIKNIGIDYKDYIQDPVLYAKRFIKDIRSSKPSDKPRFITRFYTYVLPKKSVLKEAIIADINTAWKEKFGDRRLWRYPMTEEQRIVLWKRFRYDKEKNPEQKWLLPYNRMGNIFSFAYHRKKNIYLFKKIEKYFTRTEIEELKSEGFFDEKQLIHQIT